MNAKLSVFFSVLVVIAAGVVPGVASADPSMAVRSSDEGGYVGVVPHHGYVGANGAYVHDFYFELPDAVAREVSVGSVLQSDDASIQRVVVVEPHVGYCIDRDRHAGTESTRFRFNGMRDEVAAHVARVARERGQVASQRVWAWRESKARTSH